MESKSKHERRIAVQRFFDGEEPAVICASIGRSRSWLYKWVARYAANDPAWCEESSRQPLTSPHRTPAEIEELVELVCSAHDPSRQTALELNECLHG